MRYLYDITLFFRSRLQYKIYSDRHGGTLVARVCNPWHEKRPLLDTPPHFHRTPQNLLHINSLSALLIHHLSSRFQVLPLIDWNKKSYSQWRKKRLIKQHQYTPWAKAFQSFSRVRKIWLFFVIERRVCTDSYVDCHVTTQNDNFYRTVFGRCSSSELLLLYKLCKLTSCSNKILMILFFAFWNLHNNYTRKNPYYVETFHMIDSCDSAIAGWDDDGLTFTVKDPNLFESKIIPQFFKHSKFSSFVRVS